VPRTRPPDPEEFRREAIKLALLGDKIRRDLRKYAGDTKQGRRDLLEANEHLSSFDKPVLVAWAAEDKVMPPEAGRRLAASFPDSRFVEIPGSRTLIPIDQPAAIADAIAGFASET
jgi:pimeloyl-ACP methyl ester carboxylesterase